MKIIPEQMNLFQVASVPNWSKKQKLKLKHLGGGGAKLLMQQQKIMAVD